MKRPDAVSPDELEEARRLYPPAPLPAGLASTPRMVEGIRRKLARRQALARRRRVLGAAGVLATCAAAAIVFGTWRVRGTGSAAEYTGPTALACEEAFARYEREFAADPEEEAFEELETLISALDYDFSDFGRPSI